jgi:hypothetical protein
LKKVIPGASIAPRLVQARLLAGIAHLLTAPGRLKHTFPLASFFGRPEPAAWQ